jgi:hypothetical protein
MQMRMPLMSSAIFAMPSGPDRLIVSLIVFLLRAWMREAGAGS